MYKLVITYVPTEINCIRSKHIAILRPEGIHFFNVLIVNFDEKKIISLEFIIEKPHSMNHKQYILSKEQTMKNTCHTTTLNLFLE